MAKPTPQGDLFPDAGVPEGTAVINDRCQMRTQGGHRVVVVAGVVLAQYAIGDRMAEAHAMVGLVEQGWAHQNDVASAFGRSSRTLRRHQIRFDEGGLAALGRAGGYPKGRPRLSASRVRGLNRLKAQGISNRRIAARLGISEMAVRKRLRRLGWKDLPPAQATLSFESTPANPNVSAFPRPPQGTTPSEPVGSANPNLSAFSSPEEPRLPSLDRDPSDRRFDRLMAYLGLLDDAEPIFRPGSRVPGAGVLLAIPALVASGVLECAREIYGTIGPAFYGLRTTMVALVLMALLRIKRPEGLKEHPPDDLGRILGLDRAPEVKTLRRKLARLSGLGGAARFGRALAERRVAARGASLGFLYVDGHVRVYHGKHTIPKAHVARMRISMPATTDYWVNDAGGEPLFVVTSEANAGLAKMLPPILDEVRSHVGERRVTVVFDRGGWSPKLFEKLLSAGFDLLTYRKGPCRRVPKGRFRKHAGKIAGRKVSYVLADQGVPLLGGKLRLRQVTRRSEDGHQTPIITSRRDLPALEVAYRMFERWRQENFFKYLREEYALDALLEYAVEPDDPARDVPNPEWQAADTRLREARAALAARRGEYGLAALSTPEGQCRTMRGFKIAHASLGRDLRAAVQLCLALEKKRAAVPRRVPIQRIVGPRVVRLAAERQHLTSLLKMVAYQAESDLVRLVRPHYRRAEDEGRTLIQSALASPADIEVGEREVRVLLAPLSSAHRTRAIAAVCEDLNLHSALRQVVCHEYSERVSA
ncbi:MAG: transposase [Planctomycetes bacterium]|nr:transposase [Planctomycetota bacterium]